jgi:hypothetical protein
MTMRMSVFTSLVAAVFLAPPLVVGQDAEADRKDAFARSASASREQMQSLERYLERAVAEVSVSHAGILLGRTDSSRGYRLPGYGIVFVLTPRALPGQETVYVWSDHPRKERARPGPDREERVLPTTEEDDIEALERQVLILQHAAEAHRRAAEEDHERIVRDIRIRLARPPEEEHTGREAEPEDEAAPLPAGDLTVFPPPAPWSFWFDTPRTGDERTPERVVADVREAVIEALESRGGAVPGLEADEFVTVAVDFVPGELFAAHQRPTRTLIVRARQKDLAARGRGAMAAEELRARVETIEY